MMTEDDMVHPDPQLGELIIAAARIRLGEQIRGIPAPAFRFPASEQEAIAPLEVFDETAGS